MKINKILFLSVLSFLGLALQFSGARDCKVKLEYVQSDAPAFKIGYQNQPETVFTLSDLGFTTSQSGLFSNLKLKSVSGKKNIDENYVMLTGKRSRCINKGYEISYLFEDSGHHGLRLTFRVFNDGLAFRYEIPEADSVAIVKELTTFSFPSGIRRWTQRYRPGYEGFFDKGNGEVKGEWSFPALFEIRPSLYVLLSEAGVYRDQCGSKLTDNSRESDYQVTLIDDNFKVSGKGWTSPWRVAIIGSLSDIVESTLITDVSLPCKLKDTSWINPGVTSWIYWAYNHGSKDFQIVKQYVDFADSLKLPYVLIDWEWDNMENGGNIYDALNYAKEKGVKPLLWYNSSTSWRVSGPLDRLNSKHARVKEYAWLDSLGVKGVKIDFFPADTRSTVNYYIDLLEDAADSRLLVDFHGSTIPRGWQRTYPNLMSYEAVYGAEWYNNRGEMTEMAPQHNATLPFTRNVIGSMDYTPCAFSDSQHPHKTTNAHELALTVIFESGLQNLADRPSSILAQPDQVKKFFTELPASWDDTKLLAGYPAEYVVMARRKGDTWYIGAINGTAEARDLPLDIRRLDCKKYKAMLFRDGPVQNSFEIEELASGKLPDKVKTAARGGFVLVLTKK